MGDDSLFALHCFFEHQYSMHMEPIKDLSRCTLDWGCFVKRLVLGHIMIARNRLLDYWQQSSTSPPSSTRLLLATGLVGLFQFSEKRNYSRQERERERNYRLSPIATVAEYKSTSKLPSRDPIDRDSTQCNQVVCPE